MAHFELVEKMAPNPVIKVVGVGGGGGMAAQRLVVVELSAHDRDLLDDLGDALEGEHHEADHDQPLGRPLRQAAGRERLLVDRIGAQEERHRMVDDEQGEGHQEEHVPDQIDPVLGAPLRLGKALGAELHATAIGFVRVAGIEYHPAQIVLVTALQVHQLAE